jgi:hypothetical protein
MRMRVSLSAAILILTGCADPLGPPFGLGPAGDSTLGIVMLFLLAVVLYCSARSKRKRERQNAPAMHIVRERYARGELTREEFQNLMRDLSSPPNPSDSTQ